MEWYVLGVNNSVKYIDMVIGWLNAVGNQGLLYRHSQIQNRVNREVCAKLDT